MKAGGHFAVAIKRLISVVVIIKILVGKIDPSRASKSDFDFWKNVLNFSFQKALRIVYRKFVFIVIRQREIWQLSFTKKD